VAVLDNIERGEFEQMKRDIRMLMNRTTLNNAAIGRAGMEVYGGGVLNVSDGNLIVNGTATISGVLNADGTVTLSGTVGITGPLTVTGATALNGATTVGGNTTVNGNLTTNGPLDVNGTTTLDGNATATGTFTTNGPLNVNGESTLTGNLNVTGGGKIKAGNVTIDPSTGGGAVRFTSGRVVRDTGSSMIMDNGSGSATVSVTSSHAMLEAGTAKVDVVGNTVGIVGDLDAIGKVFFSLPTTTLPANVRIDPTTGELFRSTA
jgi:cytoskeletal protein CcmA (bactofilin family)